MGRPRIFTSPTPPADNLSAELMQTANQTAARQLGASGGGTSTIAGSLTDGSAHMAAIGPFAFLVLMLIALFYLVFHSHVSLAASVGVGK